MLWKKWAVLGALAWLGGCSAAQCRTSAYGPEGMAEAMPAEAMPMEKSFVDRHPVFAAPRNYYRDSGDNIFVKGFAATIVGIPVGIAREGWQVVYGQ